jgi:hypothetical protein
MDFAKKHSIVREVWESERDPDGEFNDSWVSFFVDYFPIESWVLNTSDGLSDLQRRQVELTHQALLASLGVAPDGDYQSWWDVLGSDEVADAIMHFDDPTETDPQLWIWPE